MSCPSRTSGWRYTPNQIEHLKELFRAGAVSRATGFGPLTADLPANHFARRLNALVVGALRDRGLAESRSRRVGGRSWTEYWLTELGAAEARLLTAGQPAVQG